MVLHFAHSVDKRMSRAVGDVLLECLQCPARYSSSCSEQSSASVHTSLCKLLYFYMAHKTAMP